MGSQKANPMDPLYSYTISLNGKGRREKIGNPNANEEKYRKSLRATVESDDREE
jgi:hypothetical protein